MNLRDFTERGYDLYAEFAKTVGRIVRIALEHSDTGSRLQAWHVRAKDTKSLRKKLEIRGILESNDIEAQIKDLAGCRLIFYTNNDVNAFLSSRLIVDNFDVDWDKSKLHQPLDEQQSAYVATHYVVGLKGERLALPEYEKFRGLQCEIQVQSILNHAWAETSHDIVYKKPTLEGFGSKQFGSIERRMQEIMTKHLLPAGYEFQKIQRDFTKLLEGRTLFEAGGLDKLDSCANNNDRFDTLERFREFVLPQHDDVVAAFPGIRQQLVRAVEAARATETLAVETPFGVFPGKSYEQVTDIALDILERLRYVNVDEVFSALCEIYIGKKSDVESERILKSVENLAEHNLEVWKQAGPFVQSRICARIEAMGAEEREPLVPLVAKALSQVLRPEAESTSSTYSSLTLHRAAVRPSTALAEVRQAAINLLKGMYSVDRSEHLRRMLLSAIWVATDMPRVGGSTDELDLMILNDSTRIVEFLTVIADGESFEVIQHLEHQALWLFKRYQKWTQENDAQAARAQASRNLRQAIEVLRDKVNRNREYVIYKTLVGFESTFPPEWTEPGFDHRAQDGYRKAQIAVLLESIQAINSDDWKRRIIRCAGTESADLATFPYLAQFLADLARMKPELVIEWLQDLDEKLERFLPSMLHGLEKSTAAAPARAIADQWITAGRHLRSVARATRLSDRLDIDLLKQIVEAAKRNDDVVSLIDVIATIFEKCTVENFSGVRPVSMDVITHCTVVGENRWIHEAWFRAKESPYLGLLEADDVKAILINLETVNKVDYQIEAILTKLADRYPDLVLEFFGARLRLARDDKPDSEYEGLPYRLHELDKVLHEHAALVVGLARQLFNEDHTLFEFRGGRLLRIVFPMFTDELEGALIEQVRDSGEAGVSFVLQLLRNYEGQPFLHKVVKEVICALREDDNRLGLVEIVLESAGVTTGEFGLRDAYRRKKDEVAPWLTDDRAKVKAFAERYLRSLDRQIAAEQRRAQEDIEMRKLEYGENDESD